MENLIIKEVNIKDVKCGDFIMHNNEIRKVENGDLIRGTYLQIYLFRDSYNLGQKKVKKIIENKPHKGRNISKP